MTLNELKILGFIFKQGLQTIDFMIRLVFHMLRAFINIIKGMDFSILRTECSAHSDEKLRIFGHNDMFGSQMQRFNKTLTQLRQKIKRTSQKRDVSTDRFSAGQSGNGLIDDGLENRGCHIFPMCAFIQKRLNIRFSEHAAACGNGINRGGFLR